MTFSNDKWVDFWRQYFELSDTLKVVNSLIQYTSEMILAIHRLIKKWKEVLWNTITPLFEKLKDLFSHINLVTQEEISCNKLRHKRIKYNCKPQLAKVNTKGYSRCFLPVARRYI